MSMDKIAEIRENVSHPLPIATVSDVRYLLSELDREREANKFLREQRDKWNEAEGKKKEKLINALKSYAKGTDGGKLAHNVLVELGVIE